MNTLLHIDSIMTFTPFKGYSLRQIYQYAPEYITWLIEETERFYVDFSQFENLPIPTPYTYTERRQLIAGKGPFIESTPLGRNSVVDALKYKADGNIIPEKPYIFHAHIQEINELKRIGGNHLVIDRYTPFTPKQ